MREKLYKPFSSQANFTGVNHIVIGSGIGGLTTAAWLARAGQKVVILERHYTPGGFTHSFKRTKGFNWDVGVHYVGGMGDDSGLKKLFDFITGHKLKWQSMGEVYDVVNIGDDTYKFKAGEKEWKEEILKHFPGEEATLNKYLKHLKRASLYANLFFVEKAFKPVLSKTIGWVIRKLFRRYSAKTTLETLSEITENKRLIAVLCSQCGNYGLSPHESSFAAHALVINHFMEGGYFPAGGASQICNGTLEMINKYGAELYVNAEVSQIVVEKNKVKGVVVNDLFIECNSVISNAGVYTTFTKLLGEKERERCAFDLKETQPSSGHLCLYVGLDKSDLDLSLPKYNVWNFAHDDYDKLLDDITLDDAPNKFSYISFPSSKDTEWQLTHPDSSSIQALTAGKYEWFKKYEDLPWMKRGEAYSAMKKRFENSMLKKLYQLFPQIEGHVAVTEVSTPLSTKHFSNYQHGEIYGLAHTPSRFEIPFLRPETKIKGLRLTGQDITLVGVAGAMLSGMLCAITILKYRVWKIFRDMARENKQHALQ